MINDIHFGFVYDQKIRLIHSSIPVPSNEKGQDPTFAFKKSEYYSVTKRGDTTNHLLMSHSTQNSKQKVGIALNSQNINLSFHNRFQIFNLLCIQLIQHACLMVR